MQHLFLPLRGCPQHKLFMDCGNDAVGLQTVPPPRGVFGGLFTAPIPPKMKYETL